MGNFKKIVLVLAALTICGVKAARPQELPFPYYQETVDYRDGEISVDFEQTPVVVALSAIEERTGLQIIVPASVENRLVNLRLDRLALEPAFQSLISTIGFRNFALIYGDDGRPRRAVVLDSQPELVAKAEGEVEEAAAGGEPLAQGEREKIELALERWGELKQEERGRVEDRLKTLPPSEEREKLLREYGKQVLGVKK